MHCTHCRKELTHIESANRWPLFTSAHALWPRSSALTIPNHATRLLGSYASLWNAHQSVRDLLTNLSRHSNTRTRVNEGYEINFYSASELVSRCNTVLQKLSQTQRSCDLGSSFVVCLKPNGAEICCLSDFLGAAAFSKNSTSVAGMNANPLYTHPLAGQFVLETSLPHSPVAQESSTDDVDYFVPMADESSSDDAPYAVVIPAAAAARDCSHYSQQTLFKVDTTRNWPNYDTKNATLRSTQQQWPANYETTLSAQAPNVQAEARYYSTVAEQKNGLFEKLAQQYEQFMVVFAHQPAHVCENNYSVIAGVVYEIESARLRTAPSYFQQAKNFLWRNTQRRVTTVLVTTVIIGGIVGAYLGLTHSAGSASVSSENSHDRDCMYANGVNTTFTELQETLAAGNSSLRIPGLDPATCTLINLVINNTVSALKTGGYHCWQNVQSALMPLMTASALSLTSDSLQQIIASVKQYCFPSTSTTVPAGTTTVTTLAPTTSTTVFVSTSTPTTLQTSTSTSTPVTTTTLSSTVTSTTTASTLPCCQLSVCLRYPFQNCRCTVIGPTAECGPLYPAPYFNWCSTC